MTGPTATAPRASGVGLGPVRVVLDAYARRYSRDALVPLLWRPLGAAGPAAGEPVVWDGEVAFRGRRRPALFLRTPAALACRFHVPERARLVCYVALRACGGRQSADVVISVRDADGGHVARRSAHVRGRGTGATRWRRVALDLSGFAPQEVELVVSAEPAGVATRPHDSPVVVCADPTLVAPRPVAELRAFAGTYLRSFGLRGVVARLFRRPAPPEPPPAFRPTVLAAHQPPLVSLVMVVGRDVTPEALRDTLDAVAAQQYPRWQLCVVPDGEWNPDTHALLVRCAAADDRILLVRRAVDDGVVAALNAALAEAAGAFVAPLDAGDRLAPAALRLVAERLDACPDADLLYADEDQLLPDGTRGPSVRKPAWSPEYLQAYAYVRRLCAYRTLLARTLGGFRECVAGAHEYDLVLRMSERARRIEHISEILYHARGAPALRWQRLSTPHAAAAGRVALAEHLCRTGTAAVVEDGPLPGLRRVRYRVDGDPLVSVVIPTAGFVRAAGGRPLDLLANCLRTIVERTTDAAYEVVCVHNGDLRPETVATVEALGGPPVRMVEYRGPFNVAAKMNLGARASRGAHLLFLNDDVEVLAPEWIGAMRELSAQPGIGAVGAKLYFPGHRLQHAGVYCSAAHIDHVFRAVLDAHPGHAFDLLVPRNYSAVTGACLMTRRGVFEEVGGFDEGFPVNFNDVDYCLAVGARGYRVAVTPYAELLHFESVSRVLRHEPAEARRLVDKWHRTRDPFDNVTGVEI